MRFSVQSTDSAAKKNIYIYICQQEYLISPICRCGSWQFTHPLTGLVGSVLNKYMQLSISCLESGTGGKSPSWQLLNNQKTSGCSRNCGGLGLINITRIIKTLQATQTKLNGGPYMQYTNIYIRAQIFILKVQEIHLNSFLKPGFYMITTYVRSK